MEKILRSREVKELFKAVADIKTPEECRKFMRDLCTIAEIQAMAERWQVAKLLQKGLPYREIAKKTGASTATVTRVAQWLNHGEGGYEILLERLG